MILKAGLILRAVITILIGVQLIETKCINSTDFRYDLDEPSDLVNYNGLCSQFARRTCCSENNYEQLIKKLTKVIGGNVDLSNACKFRLTNALCGICDGDIGEQLKVGTCHQYCRQFYKDCKEDYFAFDNSNQLRACKEDDIICSQLKDIVSSSKKESFCQLFQLKVSGHSCWNGQVSAFEKGPAKNKIRVSANVKGSRSRESTLWKTLGQYKHIVIPLVLVMLIAGIFVFKRMQRSYAMWKRQIRNL